jgi:hypothetical protein
MNNLPLIDLNLGGTAMDFLLGDSPADESTPAEPKAIRKLFHWTDDPSCPLVLTMDWSSLESLLACNRSAEYKLVHSRTTHTKSALIFGAAFHSALECFYKRSPEDTIESITQLGGRAIQAEYALHPTGAVDDYRTADFCFATYCQYVAQYFNETITPYIHEGKPLVEFTFVMPVGMTSVPTNVFDKWGIGKLTNNPDRESDYSSDAIPNGSTIPCRIEWSGIIDALMRMGDGETLRVCDHKTSSISTNALFDSYSVSMQPIGYVTAMRAAFPDLNIKGFYLNSVICRKPTRTGISYESYRRPYDYTTEQCNEWKSDLLALIGELLHNLTSKNFPKKTNWCAGKYGACPYLDVCSAPSSQRAMILNTGMFADNTWKPGT